MIDRDIRRTIDELKAQELKAKENTETKNTVTMTNDHYAKMHAAAPDVHVKVLESGPKTTTISEEDYHRLKRAGDVNLTTKPLQAWTLTTQGYVLDDWRIFQNETWCVALRTDFERLVARNFGSPESAAAWVQTLRAGHTRVATVEAIQTSLLDAYTTEMRKQASALPSLTVELVGDMSQAFADGARILLAELVNRGIVVIEGEEGLLGRVRGANELGGHDALETPGSWISTQTDK
jgi:hypothetical protein